MHRDLLLHEVPVATARAMQEHDDEALHDLELAVLDGASGDRLTLWALLLESLDGWRAARAALRHQLQAAADAGADVADIVLHFAGATPGEREALSAAAYGRLLVRAESLGLVGPAAPDVLNLRQWLIATLGLELLGSPAPTLGSHTAPL